MSEDSRLAELLSAVLEAPDQDEPRLVLSDYLLERQDPRGEFISLQVRLKTGPVTRSMRSEFLQRQARLLDRHRDDWTRPLGLEGIFRFRRGFIDELEADGKAFLEAAEAIFAREPIQHVSLTGLPKKALGKQDKASWPARLRTLKLRTRNGLDRKDLKVVATRFTSLRSLNLGECGLGEDAGAILAAGPTLTNLERLSLSGNSLGDEGVKALVASPGLSACRALYLSRNDLSDAALQALASSPHLANLERLGLDGNGEISDEGLGALGSSLTLAKLSSLELERAGVGEGALKKARGRFRLLRF